MASRRLLSNAVLVGLALFIALMAVAMACYPGGTCWDVTTRGHRFWQNFLCDLEWAVARNGEPNPIGSRAAEGAMVILALAMAPHWILVARVLATRPVLAGLVRGLGLAAVAGSLAVTVVPSNRFGVVLHAATVVVAGVPGLSATTLAVAGLFTREPRPRIAATLGAALLAVAAGDFVLYLGTLVFGGPGPVLIPAAEKVALVLLLAWMARVAVAGRREGGTEASV